MAKGGGGNAHDRKVASTKVSSGVSKPKPLPTPVLEPPINMPLETSKPFNERLLAFLEHGLVLTPLGIFGGILGIVYTPFLFITVLCVLGAIHRTKLVSSLVLWKQVAAYLLVGCISYSGCYFTIFEVKQAANLTTNQIIDGVTKKLATMLGPSKNGGEAPITTPVAPPPPKPASFPDISPELPTLGFQDDADEVSVTFGTNTGGNHVALLKKMTQPVYPITVDDFSPVSFWWNKDHVSYRIKFWSPDQRAAVEVNDGKFVVRNISLDSNFTKNALEVVAGNGQPILQVIWMTPGHMRLNGLFPLSDGLLLCMSNDMPRTIPIGLADECKIKPIFKYPSWRHRGEYNEEGSSSSQ
jgi:hypothetical protein